MYRRRRPPPRDVAFSFDSFLDIVANVVGIILRLILVAWVGARSYKAFIPPPPPPPLVVEADEALPPLTSPLTAEVERQRQTVAEVDRVAREREREVARSQPPTQREKLAELARRQGQARVLQEKTSARLGALGKQARTLALSVEELEKRSRKLQQEIDALRALPTARKTLRHPVPLSQPLQTEEAMFECRKGRVCLLDLGALLEHIKRDLPERSRALRVDWRVEGVTEPAGSFRLRYVVEREREALDSILPGGVGPASSGGFRYGLSSWVAEPVEENRGEDGKAALAEGSAFRRVTDRLDVKQTAVTLWVYEDSIALYRQLRDHLHARGVTVAGRPLPPGTPIAASRSGSQSRGQ